jgi:hypothetical protein
MNATMKTWQRRVLLLLGIALVGVGVVGGYLWFYRLAPMRRLWNPDWRRAHSAAAAWAEEQKGYRRSGDSPDISFRGDTLGYFGNKDWAVWLVGSLKKKGYRFCGCTWATLSLLTNQRIDENEDAWVAWLEKHRNESQEQWIQQGFAEYGVKVHLPPVAEDAAALLSLLGDCEKDAKGELKVPGWLKYNAFRWLRDSGFNWREYTAGHPDWRSSEKRAVGVCCYASFEAEFPPDEGMGRLAFGKPGSSRQYCFADLRPIIATRAAKVAAYAIIFGGIAIGGVFMIVSLGMKRREKWTMSHQSCGMEEASSGDLIDDDSEE